MPAPSLHLAAASAHPTLLSPAWTNISWAGVRGCWGRPRRDSSRKPNPRALLAPVGAAARRDGHAGDARSHRSQPGQPGGSAGLSQRAALREEGHGRLPGGHCYSRRAPALAGRLHQVKPPPPPMTIMGTMSLWWEGHCCSQGCLQQTWQGRCAKSYLPVVLALGSPYPLFFSP